MIDYFKGNVNEKVDKLHYIISNNIPFGICNIVYQEILQGAKDEKEFKLLKEYLSSQRFYDLKNGKESYEKAAELYFKCKEKGINIRSTIDVIIAQIAIKNDLLLLHNDKGFSQMALVKPKLKEF